MEKFNEIIFSRLFQSEPGASFPVLIELHNNNPEITPDSWFFTSNNQNIQWGGETYISAPMSYKFPTSQNGVPQGGVLEIDVDVQDEGGGELLKWFDDLDHRASIDVTGLINEQGEIVPISRISQSHGNVTWDGEKINWTLGADDRLNMQINPWAADNNFLTG